MEEVPQGEADGGQNSSCRMPTRAPSQGQGSVLTDTVQAPSRPHNRCLKKIDEESKQAASFSPHSSPKRWVL